MTSTIENKSILQSVQNGLQILKLFSKENLILGITEISRELELPKSTVSRLMNDLISEGYIRKVGRKYTVGLSILGLTGVIMSQLELHREAFDPLKCLVNKLNENAHVSTLDGTHLIYILKVESKQTIRLLSHVGHHRPPTCSAPGKLLLAFQPSEIVDQVIQAGLPKRGPNSVTDPNVLVQQLKQIKQDEYCVCIDEMHEDVVSIAAPIKNYTGKVIASVSVSAPRLRIGEDLIPQCVEEIIKTGKKISAKLGYMESLRYEGEF
ncbi:IclR family transcriptional regulator [Niallia oryzisoli]|uniref:IclR family transcriptional regulator n=1 Tax=Niallia oryzisoli TaxID=1737571 RepID=A0ABZ2CH00_9BACI